MTPYERAQRAVCKLKVAVLEFLEHHRGREGLTNAEIGRALGIYMGHVGHEGHISRTILALLQEDKVIAQDSGSKRWTLAPQRVEDFADPRCTQDKAHVRSN